MNKHEWLIGRGYKHDETTDEYIFEIRIFEYGARAFFSGWDVASLSLEEIQARHDEFIRRALNREQF